MPWRRKMTMWWALFGPRHLDIILLVVFAVVLPYIFGAVHRAGGTSAWSLPLTVIVVFLAAREAGLRGMKARGR